MLIIPKDLLANEDIKSNEVRVVDESGDLGIMHLKDALALASRRGLDLVEISPGAVPPVCRIADRGKLVYERQKREKKAKQRQKVVELKKIRLSVKIDTGDLERKMDDVRKFISSGNKVEVSIRFRGRESQHSDLGFKVLSSFCDSCSSFASVTKKPNLDGRQLSAIISPISKKSVSSVASPVPFKN